MDLKDLKPLPEPEEDQDVEEVANIGVTLLYYFVEKQVY